MSIWDVALDRLQGSRLLALRMHVARYVVRAGAQQRSVAVVLGPGEMECASTLLELLEAAGAATAEVVSGAPVPAADIVLVSRRQDTWLGSLSPLPLDPRAAVWAIDVEQLAGAPDARIVESVEALIRIVMPEALGANGTPPDEAVAVRLA